MVSQSHRHHETFGSRDSMQLEKPVLQLEKLVLQDDVVEAQAEVEAVEVEAEVSRSQRHNEMLS